MENAHEKCFSSFSRIKNNTSKNKGITKVSKLRKESEARDNKIIVNIENCNIKYRIIEARH